MIVGVIVEFGPRAESELLHVRQLRLVMDVLQRKDREIDRWYIGSAFRIQRDCTCMIRSECDAPRRGLAHY